MPWNSHLGSENIFGTVLAMLMVLDAYTAGDRTMEGNLLGSEGTGGPIASRSLGHKPPCPGKSGETLKVPQQGSVFSVGEWGGFNHERVYP
jgi:hypothetical protein